MRPIFDTIRSRILAGLVPLVVGLVGAALLGAATLRQMRRAVAAEFGALHASGEIGSGLVATVFEEIRDAERYLAAPRAETRRQFQAAAEEASLHEQRLEGLANLTIEDRLTVGRLKQLHAAIQVDYSIAHALKDLGRDREALAQSLAVRPRAEELTRLVRDLASRQARKATQAADRLADDSQQRERTLWLLLALVAVGGSFLARWTLQSVQGPLGRLITAAERLASGDLRPVTTGDMPREFRV